MSDTKPARSAWPAVGLLALAGLACGGGGGDGGGAGSPAGPSAPLRDGEGVFGEWVAAGGVRRTYAVHMPPGADRSRPLPLILAFHGASGDRGFAESAGLHRAADRRGFIVVSPHGVAGDWALGCGCTQPDRQGVDDVRFFDTLVAHVSSHVAVDPDRVYVTGFSNGATFSYRLACERAQAVAAAGIVAGSVFDAEACRPVRPMPVLAFHGSSDPVLGYLGGYFAAQAWARLDGCGTSPTATPLPDRADDDTRLWRYDFPGCAGGSQVVFYSIDGGGHTWPGAEYPASSPLQSREIEASEEIVDFFARHTRR